MIEAADVLESIRQRKARYCRFPDTLTSANARTLVKVGGAGE